jgi:hypothetical protein
LSNVPIGRLIKDAYTNTGQEPDKTVEPDDDDKEEEQDD